jgi:spermidine synthase
MLPRTLIDIAEIPGSGTLRLIRRGAEFSIMLGANELMNSRLSGSEEALATLACERLRERRRPHLLVGGLGMGFTLRAALGALGPEAKVTVVELSPAVAAWARGPMAGLFAGSLDDPRTTLMEDDVVTVIGGARGGYDAILLDVDNGPEGLTRKANDRLYTLGGLAAARRALRPGGVLAVWSSVPDPAFTKRLRTAGYAAEEAPVRARGGSGRGARHMIWLATAPG